MAYQILLPRRRGARQGAFPVHPVRRLAAPPATALGDVLAQRLRAAGVTIDI